MIDRVQFRVLESTWWNRSTGAGGPLERDVGEEPSESEGEAERAPARRVKASSLLWFISNRPYVPISDIRRRFDLYSEHGTMLRDEEGPLHLGLPEQAAATILDLRRRNKIEFEYDYAYEMRIVIGVFPLRVRVNEGPAPRRERADPTSSVPATAVESDLDAETLGEVGEGAPAQSTADHRPPQRRRSRSRRQGRQ